MSDPVHSPSHYCHGGIECADMVEALLEDAKLDGNTSWWWGNLLKYAMRWPFKGGTPTECLRDLDKAEECLRRTREAYEKEDSRRRKRVAEMVGDPQ